MSNWLSHLMSISIPTKTPCYIITTRRYFDVYLRRLFMLVNPTFPGRITRASLTNKTLL